MESLPAQSLTHGIDIWEDALRFLDRELLHTLLCDRTTKKNIVWATDDYASLGPKFGQQCEITPDLITGSFATLIQPRITKSQSARLCRTRDKAEVFTPAWICNKQNNLIDQQWFGRENVFNREVKTGWVVSPSPVSFEFCERSWQNYVDAPRLEVACGEAPYLVSRYDTVTGIPIPLHERIGLLDRKMRIVGENTFNKKDWLTWAQRAFESVYGFEYQGDNLLLARENLLYSYIEYYQERFGHMPDIVLLRKIACIISWNIWQMDGLKCVAPGSCRPKESGQFSLLSTGGFTPAAEPCPGCAKGDIQKHTGAYCKIMDWRGNRSQTFVSMLMGGVL